MCYTFFCSFWPFAEPRPKEHFFPNAHTDFSPDLILYFPKQLSVQKWYIKVPFYTPLTQIFKKLSLMLCAGSFFLQQKKLKAVFLHAISLFLFCFSMEQSFHVRQRQREQTQKKSDERNYLVQHQLLVCTNTVKGGENDPVELFIVLPKDGLYR